MFKALSRTAGIMFFYTLSLLVTSYWFHSLTFSVIDYKMKVLDKLTLLNRFAVGLRRSSSFSHFFVVVSSYSISIFYCRINFMALDKNTTKIFLKYIYFFGSFFSLPLAVNRSRSFFRLIRNTENTNSSKYINWWTFLSPFFKTEKNLENKSSWLICHSFLQSCVFWSHSFKIMFLIFDTKEKEERSKIATFWNKSSNIITFWTWFWQNFKSKCNYF